MAGVTVVTASGEDFDGILYNLKWSDTTITYSFPTSASNYGSPYGALNELDAGFEALNATQIAAVEKLLGQIESFTGLTFNRIAETDVVNATLRFAMTDNTATAHAYTPHIFEESGDSWYRNDGTYDDPTIGNFAYNEGFMHELGHALGLAHGHDDDGLGTLAAELDSNEFSVMTYRDYIGDGIDGSENETWGNPQSYMMLDIAALQYLYGANYSTSGEIWSGDTTYSFDGSTGQLSINGVAQDRPSGAARVFQTIWDGHGTDTYDLTDYTTDVDVDLRPGEWSTFKESHLADLNAFADGFEARGNVANALLVDGDTRSLIENAVSGVGDDKLAGNQVANILNGNSGNDFLTGYGGDDTLIGGLGRDTAFFVGSQSEYTIGQLSATSVQVEHTGGTGSDGRDELQQVELARFSDGQVALDAPSGALDVVFVQNANNRNNIENVAAAALETMASIEETNPGSRFALTSMASSAQGRAETSRVVANFTDNPGSIASAYSSISTNEFSVTDTGFVQAIIFAANNAGLNFTPGADRVIIIHANWFYYFPPNDPEFAAMKAALEANDVIPVFVAREEFAIRFHWMVEDLDRGAVAEVQSDSSDYAEAVGIALAQLRGEVTDVGTSDDDTISGTEFYDHMVGRDGDDTFSALGGDDTLNGGAGTDTLDGGSGTDTASYDGTLGALTIDLAAGTTTGADTDTLINIESVIGGSGNDLIFGTTGVNLLSGGAGDDIFYGRGGGDTFNGGSGSDLVGYNGVAGALLINLVTGQTTGALTDTLIDIESAVGGSGNDTLTGNGSSNVLYSDGGNDTVVGSLGNDILNGGAGIDIVDYRNIGTGLVVNLLTGMTTGAFTDTLAGFESIVGGSANDILVGDDLLNTLTGGSGNDILFGFGGNDIIDGGVGDQDVSVYAGIRSNVSVHTTYDGSEFVTTLTDLVGTSGTDTLTNIEVIEFGSAQLGLAGIQQNANSNFDSDPFNELLFHHATSNATFYVDMDDGGRGSNIAFLGQVPGWTPVDTADMFGTGLAQVLYQNQTTGALVGYGDNGGGGIGWTGYFPALPVNWTFEGIGDFTGDGFNDLLIMGPTGNLFYYDRDSIGVDTGWMHIGTTANVWDPVDVGDFDKDGVSDILVQNRSSGTTYFMDMDAGVFSGWSLVAAGGGSDLVARGAADLNGDGFDDAIYRNQVTGEITAINMAGGVNSGSFTVGPNLGTSYDIAGMFDYDNDGYDDIIVRYAPTGQHVGIDMNNGNFVGFDSLSPILGNDWILV